MQQYGCGRLAAIVALAGALSASLYASAHAQAPAAPFKEFSVYIGSSTGGGYDQYGRLLARHIGSHLPGKPTVIPRNMPAGSGRAVMNYIYNVAPKDGSAIGITLRNVAFDPLMGVEGSQFEAGKLTWIGSMNSETSICVAWKAAGFKGLDDIKAKTILMGSGGPSASDSIHAKLLNKVAGTKMKIIEGYQGSTEVHLAMERGEVQGRCGLGWDSILARYKKWLDEDKVVLLAQFAVDKNPDLPNVPFVMDLATTTEHRQMLELMLGPNKMGRPVFAPPGLPAERVAMLRRAFDATMADKALIADGEKMSMGADFMTGQDVAAMVAKLYATPKDVVEQTVEIMGVR
ncbi:MAG: Bug family tripartite tricarboxylate transporter substrate binding protein [Alphaproteobacteria bacterium]